ncbi:MAG: choice-of-anchor D domain-containing protein [Candidatus Kapabacteria bacterium]|nr:choice-of-anchor D domain-containing protein [Candidatus Kapabacteria bacterium]
MYLRLLSICFLTLTLASTARGQSVSVFGLKVGPWPTTAVQILSTDVSGKPVRPNTSDIEVWEEGVRVQNLSVICPQVVEKRPASVALSIDISNSMSRNIPPEVMALAKQFSMQVVDGLAMPPSDVALQVCNDVPRILLDYTSNATRLRSLISTVTPGGDNEFVGHLLDNDAGLLNIAARGKNQRAAILVTDAFWEALKPAVVQQAIDICIQNNVRFYVIVMTERGLATPGIVESFKAIAEASGGEVFEGAITDTITSSLAASLVTTVEGAEPCTLTWDSWPLCPDATARRITIGVRGVDTVTVDYSPQLFEKRELTVVPNVVRFTALPVGGTATATVRVTAKRSPINVSSIIVSDPAFSIAPSTISLQEGEFTDLVVTYTSDGRDIIGTTLILKDSTCPWSTPSIRVSRSVSPGVYDLDVNEPNGKEEIFAGSDTIITWSSGDTTRPVDVDVTINYGASWISIARNVIGTQARWSPVPFVESNECLARVTSTTSPLPDSLLASGMECTSIAVAIENSDSTWGGSIAIGTAYGYLARGKPGYLRLDHIWQPHTDTVTDVVCSRSNPSWILTGSTDSSCALHNGISTVLNMNHGAPVRAVQFIEGTSLCLSAGDDGRIVEWNQLTGAQIRVVTQFSKPILSMRCIGRDSIAAVTSDGILHAIRRSSATTYWQSDTNLYFIRSIEMHNNMQLIAVGTLDGQVGIINAADGSYNSVPSPISSTQSPIVDVTFGNDNTTTAMIIAVCENGEAYSTIPNTASTTPLTHYSREARCVSRCDNVIGIGWSGSITTSYLSPDPLSSAFSSDVDVVVNALIERSARRLVAVTKGGWVWVWDIPQRRPSFVFRLNEIDARVAPTMSPNGQYLVLASDNATIVCYDLNDLSIAPRYTAVGAGIYVLKFDPEDDAALGVGTAVGVSRIIIPGLNEDTTYASALGIVIDFAWSPDGTKLAIVEPNASIRIIDMINGNILPTINVQNIVDGIITSIAWLPNSVMLVAASASNLSLVNTQTGFTQIQTNLDAPALEVSVSSLGTEIVVVHENRADPVQIYDAVSLTPLTGYGSSLGSRYSPILGRYAGATPVHVTNSEFGAAVLRSLGPRGSSVITDVSDTLFSIVWPRVQARDVDMGSVRVSLRKDSTVSDLVSNSTKFKLRADSLRITGANAGDFSVTIENAPGVFPSTSTSRGEVRFSPTALGLRLATCEIFVGRDTARIELTGNGVAPSMRYVSKRIDMGAHVIGDVFDSSVVVLQSIVAQPTAIRRCCLLNNSVMPFRIVNGIAIICEAPFTVAPGDSIVLMLRFSPQLIGRVSTVLEIETDDGLGPYVISVLGTGIGPIIGIRSDSGYPGDRRPLTLEMRGQAGTIQGGTTISYEADISFDPSVVVPQAGTRTTNGMITTRGTWSGMDSVIGSIPATIVLGRADSSIVTINRFVWFDDQGAPIDRDLRLENGVYRVLGICDDNGKRLFDPLSGVRTLVTTNGVDVSFSLTESSSIVIQVLSMQGRSVLLREVTGLAGQFAIPIDLTELAHGAYIIRTTAGYRTTSALIMW